MKRTSTKFYSDKPESENPQKLNVAALKNYKKICNESLGSKNSKNIGIIDKIIRDIFNNHHRTF